MNKQKIVIKSSKTSPRLVYVLDFIFNQFFDCAYSITSDGQQAGLVLAYSADSSKNGWHISQSDYLFADQIRPKVATVDPSSASFDLFAFVFYQLSRAEEYKHDSKDDFGRFTSSQVSHQAVVTKPMVDLLLLEMAEKIYENFGLELKRRENFRLIHTVDVDQVFAYKHKSLKRKVGGAAANILKGDIARLKDRAKSFKEGADPYDTFDLLEDGAKNAEAHYFILVGDYNKVDNALTIEKEEIKNKILELSKHAEIGIHPSVESNKKPDLLQQEIKRLESIISRPIKNSRQHFLQLEFPKTYRKLVEQGIECDYSLGFHDAPGFRAGTTNSFYWFDLERNEATKLRLYPLIAMDVSLKKYLNLSPEVGRDHVKALIDECRNVGGPISLLWHNSSFYEEEGWEGWKETYLELIKYCQELMA